MGLIEQMLEVIDKFVEEITSCRSIESCIPIQERFTTIVEKAMDQFKEGKIDVDVKALHLPMYFWATKELPEKIKNQENSDAIKNELILFKNSILHIIHPKEKS